MGGKSTVARLPAPIVAAVEAALEAHRTIDEVVAVIQGMGGSASRSAVGRYAQDFAEIIRQRRAMKAAIAPFVTKADDPNDDVGRMLVNLMQSAAAHALMPVVKDGVDEPLSGLELSRLASAVKSTIAARATDEKRLREIRRETREQAMKEAAVAAEHEARAAGADEATIDRIKRGLLGLVE